MQLLEKIVVNKLDNRRIINSENRFLANIYIILTLFLFYKI